MDAAINHKEIRMDKGSDFLADDFLCDICVLVPFTASPNKVEPTHQKSFRETLGFSRRED